MLKLKEKLVEIAMQYVGIRELGYNSGSQVEQFQRAVDGKAERESWCMAFVMHCVKSLEAQSAHKSGLYKSEHCLSVWNKTPEVLRLSKAEPGAIVIWQHCKYIGGVWQGTTSGHTGIVHSVDESFMSVIEGNTNAQGSREGGAQSLDGVYLKVRPLKGSGALKIKGYLRPF